MYKVLIFMLFCFPLHSQSFLGIVQNGKLVNPFEYLQTDKVAHLGVGYILGSSINAGIHKYVDDKDVATGLSALAVFIVGAGKELYDLRHGGDADELDAWATFYGGVAGSLTVRYVYRLDRPKPEKRIRYYY